MRGVFAAALTTLLALGSCSNPASTHESAARVAERRAGLEEIIEIHNCAELQAMENDLGAHYQLANDIDCAGFDAGDGGGFRPVGVGGWIYTPFEGHFDGAGHVIRNLSIDRPFEDSVGLFGLAGAAVIERVGLENVSIVGYEAVGAVVGATEDTLVREVYATGSTSGHLSGAVVGFLKYDGILRDSYSRLTVDWEWQGGLLSDYLYNGGHLERSYSAGTGDEGRLYGDIGEGGEVIASFFDCEVAGDCTNEGGETTAHLKSQSFLVAQGWDFTNVWALSTVDGYPCLRWQPGCGTSADAGTDAGMDASTDACAPSGPDTDCDGVDDDCDGVADEGYVSQPTSCGTGACARSGVRSCSDGNVVDSCSPGSPASSDTSCNGVDDDCDGTADEGYVPVSTSCGTGLCASHGELVCQNGVQVDTCIIGGGASVVCPAPDGCHEPGTCDPVSGACSNPVRSDGTPCANGDACDGDETCQAGACTAGTPPQRKPPV